MARTQGSSNKKLTPAQAYRYILKSIPKVLEKYVISDTAKLGRLVLAIIEEESTYNTCLRGYAKTSSGWAWGLTQLTDGTMTDVKKWMGWKQSMDRCDPQDAADLGTAFLAHLYNKFGDWHRALYNYNAGAYAAYSTRTYAYTYANEVQARYNKMDFAAIEQQLRSDPVYAHDTRLEFY